MLIVVSPAKSLDYDSPLPTRKHSEPRLLDRSRELVGVMAQKSPAELKKMMSISESLAELNHERFQDWDTPFTPDNARPAVLAFSGDVYMGLDASSFTERDFTHAQKVLRILSGLYGVLRPLDLMQPYRLEMGSALTTKRGRDLYGFWGDTITDVLNADIPRFLEHPHQRRRHPGTGRRDIAQSPGSKTLVNLASNEYFAAVDASGVDARIVSPAFLDSKDGNEPRVMAFFAKRARGAMAGWIIRNRLKSPRALLDFALDGYRYDPDRSQADRPVFVRHH